MKKKKKMNLVMFKKDQRFLTIDEPEEDAEKKIIMSDSQFESMLLVLILVLDVMSSFLDVTKHSLSMSISLSDVTKPRPDKRK